MESQGRHFSAGMQARIADMRRRALRTRMPNSSKDRKLRPPRNSQVLDILEWASFRPCTAPHWKECQYSLLRTGGQIFKRHTETASNAPGASPLG